MKEYYLSEKKLEEFLTYLREDEKSKNTLEKYERDIKAFLRFSNGRFTKDTVIAYKHSLVERGYLARSINSMIASLNSLFNFLGWYELKIKQMKVQREIFCSEQKELSRDEYKRLLAAAKKKKNQRLYLIIETICSTGIRVSELEYITVEAVKRGSAEISLKGKTRSIFIVRALQKKLHKYIAEKGTKDGPVFVTGTGKPISRTNIWREMKGLCADAGVSPDKVFPHNLRHLFARIFYDIEKDIAKLADVLGHSSINTTRLYIISSGKEHRILMERMGLIV